MTLRREAWGEAGGKSVHLYTLSRENGMGVSVATYGGVIVRLAVPDLHGRTVEVVLGYDSLAGYLDDQCFFGCMVGRVANRIGSARFFLGGRECRLDRNHGRHHLHGGARGFHARVWRAEAGETLDGPCLRLTRTSPDGEQGYPGSMEAEVTYTLLEDGLRLDFTASTDRSTVVSMTNHSYFNLTGKPGSNCLGHRLLLSAGRVLETDGDLIPTGALLDVAGTPLDFRVETAIGERMANLPQGRGYDHYFVLDDDSSGMKQAASVRDPESGRGMEVWTSWPGLQFYSGSHIPQGLRGKDGAIYGPGSGFCLEAHGFVDAPNHPEFPSVALEPGEIMRNTILYTFPAN